MNEYYFHKFLVTDQVFFQSRHSFALVNLKPIVPGHVLVVSNRNVPRLNDLTDEESIDYMSSIRKVAKFITHHYKSDALNIAIQDGIALGQSVPHLHTHIIPRYSVNNFGDAIYGKLETFSLEMKKLALRQELEKLESLGEGHDDEWVSQDEKRYPRSDEVMRAEANELGNSMKLFYKNIN